MRLYLRATNSSERFRFRPREGMRCDEESFQFGNSFVEVFVPVRGCGVTANKVNSVLSVFSFPSP